MSDRGGMRRRVTWALGSVSATLWMGSLAFVGCTANPGGNGGGSNTDAALKIMTVAGTGVNGINGDGLHPLDTDIYFPQDMAVGPDDGLLYMVDWNNHRIRRSNHNADGTYSVETLVGTGDLTGELQEEGPGKEAKLNHPTNIFFDNNGDILIAAWHNSQITRFSLTTDLNTIVAGTGGREYGGDGGPARSSKMNLPSSMVQDSQGNIYLSDQANQRIRKIDTDGMITTFCGTGVAGYTGDEGPAVEAQINSPSGQSSAPSGRLAIDSEDNIYFCDTANHVIRRVTKSDLMVHTVAGTGFAGYSGDGGPATDAMLNTPSDLAVAADGTIYIADTFNSVIRKVTPNGIISTFVGTGEPGFAGDGGHPHDARLQRPYGVCLANSDQDLYIADTYNSRIRIVSKNLPDLGTHTGTSEPPPAIPCTDEPGTICTAIGTGIGGFNNDGKDAQESNLYWPLEIEHTPTGKVYVNDWNNHKVRELMSDNTLRTAVGSDFIGDGPPDFSDLPPAPGAVAITTSLNHVTDMMELPDGRLLLTVWHNHKLRVYNPADGLVEVLSGRGPIPDAVVDVPLTDARFDLPNSSAIDDDGNLWIVGQKNWSIFVAENFLEEYDQAMVRRIIGNLDMKEGPMNLTGPLLGSPLGTLGGPNPEPTGWIKWHDGALWFAETQAHRVVRIEFTDDTFTDALRTVGLGTGEAGFNGDGLTGPETQLDHPHDLEFGPDGNLYVADTNNFRVRRLNMTTGLVDTVVGTGEAGYTGDGGLAVEAKINRAFGLDFDLDGNLYVCDTFNSRIRKVVMDYSNTAAE